MSKGLKFQVKKTKMEDILFLSDKLRQDDINELALTDNTPKQALLKSFIFSNECYTVYLNGIPEGVFGYFDKNYPKDWACIWFLGTDMVDKYPIRWIKEGHTFINQFLKKYKILTNKVDIRNKKHIYWLKKMGAIFFTPVDIKDSKLTQFLICRREK